MVDGQLLMGVVGRPHGVRGLVHVHSYTTVAADLPRYAPLSDERGRVWSLAWRGEGLAELRDASGRAIADRAEAEKLVNLRLFAPRDRLPPTTDEDEFYLADLIGMAAFDATGAEMGRVTAVHDYGAGSSLEILAGAESLFVPFTRQAVPSVDVAAGRIVVVPPDEVEIAGDISERVA